MPVYPPGSFLFLFGHYCDLCRIGNYAESQAGFQCGIFNKLGGICYKSRGVESERRDFQGGCYFFYGKVGEDEKGYTKHYFPKENQLKIFIKGGSSLVINLTNGEAVYEQVRKRPVISAFNRLHYNPGRWWTVFSDIFALSLLIITITGLILVKGKKGIGGRGGIELLVGILFPLLFLLFF